jgi:hypothetical protein
MEHQFERLLRRYKDQVASPEELMALFELIQSDEHDQALLEDISNTLLSTAPGLFHSDDPIKDETFERIITLALIEQAGKSRTCVIGTAFNGRDCSVQREILHPPLYLPDPSI